MKNPPNPKLLHEVFHLVRLSGLLEADVDAACPDDEVESSNQEMREHMRIWMYLM